MSGGLYSSGLARSPGILESRDRQVEKRAHSPWLRLPAAVVHVNADVVAMCCSRTGTSRPLRMCGAALRFAIWPITWPLSTAWLGSCRWSTSSARSGDERPRHRCSDTRPAPVRSRVAKDAARWLARSSSGFWERRASLQIGGRGADDRSDRKSLRAMTPSSGEAPMRKPTSTRSSTQLPSGRWFDLRVDGGRVQPAELVEHRHQDGREG